MELDRIYNMDCLEGMKQIPDGSVDCIICDLPYGTTYCAWDVVIPFDELWAQYKRIVKKGGRILLFGQVPFFAQVVVSNLQWFNGEWIWVKEKGFGFVNAEKAPLRCHENIAVFTKPNGTPTYNPQKTKGDPYKHRIARQAEHYDIEDPGYVVKEYDGMRYPNDVLFFGRERGTWHPTQKPVNLLRYLVLTYSNEGDTILDNCMGSGTTAIACIKEKRHFVGFELNKEYYEKAVKRIDAEQSQLKLFLPPPR